MSGCDRPARGLRERLFPILWMLLYPLRLYLRSFPFHRGKGVLLRHVLTPLLPSSDAEFDLSLPGNAKVALRYRETLGLSSLLYGTFEHAELQFVHRFLRPGQSVMDAGANVGLFSVVMAEAVGEQGRVFAVEPVPENVERLSENLAENTLRNVGLYGCALGAQEGSLSLRIAKDAAYHSLMEVEGGLGTDVVMEVQVQKLDDLWMAAGRPDIAFIKMDVEGAEPEALSGGRHMLGQCTPVLLIEANTPARLNVLREMLGEFGYVCEHPESFVAHNFLFYPRSAMASVRAAL